MLTHTLHPRIQQKQMHCTAYVLSAFQRKSDDTDVNQNALSTSLICYPGFLFRKQARICRAMFALTILIK